jgi:hypothetical protein
VGTTSGRWWSAGLRRLDQYRASILAAGAVYLTLTTIVPILVTPYRYDDTINRNYPEILTSGGQSLVPSLLHEWHVQTLAWMTNQGRFFPAGALWTVSVFSLFTTRETYKTLLGTLVALVVVLVAWLAVVLTRRGDTAVVVVVGLSATLTLRNYYDGLDSFAGLLPLTIALTVAAGVLLIRGRGWPSFATATLLWSGSLVTYEVGIVLTPVLCLAVWLSTRRLGRSLALLWPAAADMLLVLHLRGNAAAVAPAYQSNLEVGPMLSTCVKQTAAALPLSQYWYPGAASLDFQFRLFLMDVVLVALPVGVMLVCVLRSRPDPSWRSLGILSLIGSGAWLLPPVLVAIALRWQEELPPGQGYLSVVWGYVGVAVLTATGWLALAKRFAGAPSLSGRMVLAGSTATVSILAALNIAQSFALAGAFAFPMSTG